MMKLRSARSGYQRRRRAYPLSILSNHEIVNDVVGGEPVAITWCPLCYTALVFSRNVVGSDVPQTFGVSGQLLNNTLVMFDRESKTARAFDRRVDGRVLTFEQGKGEPGVLVDRETNSRWHPLDGAADNGPLANTRLTPLVATTAFEFGWYGYFPQNDTYAMPK